MRKKEKRRKKESDRQLGARAQPIRPREGRSKGGEAPEVVEAKRKRLGC